ncbi:hypothetical protein [Brevibacillus sp. NRS-1366]|uniref:hypothetical protein n=1 Tax=Brevibacillus sp. NRS-1366 TaxID=3233899 RepID=UPI003D240212
MKRVLLFSVIILFLVACGERNGEKNELIQGILSDEQGKYFVHVYVKRETNINTQQIEEMVDARYEGKTKKLTFAYVDDYRKDANILGINTYPTYVVLDDKGIVLQTSDEEELKKFFQL